MTNVKCPMSNVHSRIRERRKRREEDAEYEYENEYQNEILFLRLGDFLSNVECRMSNDQCPMSKLKAQVAIHPLALRQSPSSGSGQAQPRRDPFGGRRAGMTNVECPMLNDD